MSICILLDTPKRNKKAIIINKESKEKKKNTHWVYFVFSCCLSSLLFTPNDKYL